MPGKLLSLPIRTPLTSKVDVGAFCGLLVIVVVGVYVDMLAIWLAAKEFREGEVVASLIFTDVFFESSRSLDLRIGS